MTIMTRIRGDSKHLNRPRRFSEQKNRVLRPCITARGSIPLVAYIFECLILCLAGITGKGGPMALFPSGMKQAHINTDVKHV